MTDNGKENVKPRYPRIRIVLMTSMPENSFLESSWFVKADKNLGITGTQIDMIIDRRDHVINLCEIKFSVDEYIINRDYDAAIRNRIETFRTATGTKKTLQVVFITTYGVKSNMYSGIIQNSLVKDSRSGILPKPHKSRMHKRKKRAMIRINHGVFIRASHYRRRRT